MIFTLCGSARFEPVWHEANKQLGLAGHICFSLMTFPSVEGDKTWYTPEQKSMLDLMHLAKIDASDAVLMLNVRDYLGESSLRELAWARYKRKGVFWLNHPTQFKQLKSLSGDQEFSISLMLPLKNTEALMEVCKQFSEEV